MKKILAISGSLRAESSNTAILNAMIPLAPKGFSITLFNEMREIPLFSPELDHDTPPDSVRLLRQSLKTADAVIICTPEYAFGMPGALKNALDWCVSSGEFDQKPILAISASPLVSGGDKALASLLLTLTALGTQLCGSISIPSIYKKMTPEKQVNDSATLGQLKFQLKILVAGINV